MDTAYTPARIVPEDVRRSLARELSRYYHELAGAEERPEPRFSLARVVEQMAHQRGLMDGYEREVCGATATAAGEGFDRHRVLIPLQALSTRDLTVAGAGGGGYLVATDNLPSPIDVLRPWSVVAEAGVTVLPNLVGNLTVPRVTGASAAGWVSGEGATFTDGQPTAGQAAMTAKVAATTVTFSRQWRVQSGEGGELLLRQQLLGAVGKLLDEAFFAGSGASGQPSGLHITPGIGSQSGTSLAHAGLLAMRKAVLLAGGREDRLRWVGAPAVQETLGARERASGGGRFLWDDGLVLGRPAHASAYVPTGTLTVGDFGAALLGLWGPPALRLEVNPYQDFKAGRMAARVVLTCDFSFPTPAAFAVASSVT